MSLPTSSQGPAAGGGSPSPSAPAAGAATPVKFNNLELIFNGDISLLVLFGCIALFCLPRAIARVWSIGWRQGNILRSVNIDNRRARVRPTHNTTNTKFEKDVDGRSDDSHTLYTHTQFVRSEDGKAAYWSFPLHVPAVASILNLVATPLRRRISPGFSFGQALILAIYSAVMLYLTLWKSNIFTDMKRTGFVAVSQIPFVFAFGTKNNIMGGLVGLGYEKVNYIHRYIGRIIVILANLHGLGYVYSWTGKGTFVAKSSEPDIMWGFVALACLDVLVFSSTAFIRQNFYRLFITAHIVGLLIFLPAMCLHMPVITPYVLVAVGIYGLDHLVRLFKTRVTTARIRPLPELSLTRVEIPTLNSGWRAGQHVRLRVLSSGMGWWGWTESHPFTIASVSDAEEGMVLMCKKAGSWTSKLYEMAKASGYGENGKGSGGNVKVIVEGPYGGPGHTVYSSYSGAVFVCGGSGISFALSAIQELVQKDLEGKSRVKVIDLVWSIQDPASLVPLIPIFASIIQQSTQTSINISVFYTRATPGVVRITKDYLMPGLTLTPGRPKIGKVIESVIARSMSLGAGAKDSQALTGVIVGACGPVGLADDAARAVGQIDSVKRKAIGGVELHEEVFGW